VMRQAGPCWCCKQRPGVVLIPFRAPGWSGWIRLCPACAQNSIARTKAERHARAIFERRESIRRYVNS